MTNQTNGENLELTVSRKIPAARADVFKAWLNPELLSKFMLPAEGMSCPKVTNDAKVGGSFEILMKVGDQEIPHKGEYKDIEEFEKLSFTWESPFSIPGSLVTLSFKEIAPNETELTLHHKGFPNEESRSNHEGGWGRIVETLQQVLS